MPIGIYQIKNIINGKCYIGSAAHGFKQRWRLHRNQLRRGVHGNSYLQRAFDKYGEDAFEFSIIEVIKDTKDIIKREQWYLDTYIRWGLDYNICKIAGSALGVKRSKEFCANIRARSKGKKHSDEQREKNRIGHLGKKLSEETKAKLSVAGRGRKLTEEHREKISKAHTGMIFSDEHKAKLSAAKKGKIPWNKGVSPSEETRAKYSAAKTGQVLSDEHRAKISAANKGKPWSEARRQAQIKQTRGATT